MGWKCAGLVVAAVRVRYAVPNFGLLRSSTCLQAAAVVKLDVPGGVFFLSLALCQAGLSFLRGTCQVVSTTFFR
jgi:hypothetical protein